jgi:hypothetical protein
VLLEPYRRITANSLQAGLAYGSPVLTGSYCASHTVARGRIKATVREPNPRGGAEGCRVTSPRANGHCRLIDSARVQALRRDHPLPFSIVGERGE